MGKLERLWSISKKIDKRIDDTLNKYFEPPARNEYGIKARISRITRTTGTTLRGLDGFGEAYLERLTKRGGAEGWAKLLTASPLTIVLVLTIITGLIGMNAPLMLDSMRGDLELYLPPEEPATKDLKEVRSDFSADAIIVYVELPKESKRNITDYEVLLEMSHIEGDDFYNDPDDVMDWNRDGTGDGDGVLSVLSIASIIKMLNVTAANIANATGIQTEEIVGNYAIPDDQNRIDMFVEEIAKSGGLDLFVRDLDGDGIFDTAAIMIMLSSKHIGPKEVPAMVEKTNKIIKKTAKLTKMTNTGPTTMVQIIQDRTIEEFFRVVPLVIIALMVTLYVFHRTWKVWFVALMPVTYAMVIDFGLVGLLRDYLYISPQIILVAPVLLALGVSYGLYISNRFVEEKKGTPADRVERAIKAQFWPITLSAATTGIGFASLMVGTLPPIATIGLVLTIGIMLTLVMTVLLAPSIVLLVNYEKKRTFKNWDEFATTPLTHRKKIILATLSITLLSVAYCMPLVEYNADYLAMAPQDEPAIVKMNEYSEKFEAGQLGMIIVRTQNLKDPNSGAATMRIMNHTETYINEVPNTMGFSIIDIMKMVKFQGANINETPIPGVLLPKLVGKSFYDIIQSSIPNQLKAWMIDLFFDSLPVELRKVLVKDDFTKTLVYIVMPMMSVEETRAAVNEVNHIIDSYGKGIPGGSISHLTGIAAIQLAVNDLMIEGQIISLAICLFLTWCVLAIVFRSVKFAFLTILPVTLVISWEPLTLFILDIALSVITVMIGSIAIGTGVDFSIQLSQRFKQEGESLTSLKDAVAGCGISFVEATTTMVVGLMMVLIVPIDSVQEFVIMIMLLLIYSMFFALILLPAIYAVCWNMGMFAKKKRVLVEQDEWLLEKFAIVEARLESLEKRKRITQPKNVVEQMQ
ncbi:MAG: MMPL family transporter [Thermoplasmata archaeon]